MKTILLLLVLVSLVGCRQQAQPKPETGLQIDWRFEPEEPVVGDSTLIITVRDASGQAINNATVTARGDMNHAGMVPLIETVAAGNDGEYFLPFAWSMAGDWVVEITVELADGTVDSQTFDLLVTR
jgi:hypothetical protein